MVEHINAVNVGGFGPPGGSPGGTVEAAILLPPQIYMAKQLGLGVVGGEFPVIWWVNEPQSPEEGDALSAAIAAAEKNFAKGPEEIPAALDSVPKEFESHKWDYSAQFGRGERYVDAPVSKDEFETMMDASAPNS